MSSRVPLVVGGGAVYAASTYLAYLYLRPPPLDLSEDEARGCHGKAATAAIYNRLAEEYDGHMGREEWMSGITSARQELISKASGDVLEVFVGTGRNFEHYSSKVASLRGVDISPEMVQVAKAKLPVGALTVDNVMLEAGDAVASAGAGRKYDFVVDTFGLCSTDDPVGLLRAMAGACKPGGRLLLLEHGRSRAWGWISSYLDRNAPRHARQWGCWYNKDIIALVEEAGLEVDEEEVRHWGTTYLIVARPAAGAAGAGG